MACERKVQSFDSKYNFKQDSRETFRFHSRRSFNGSSNPNRRSPQTFSEVSIGNTTCYSFPNVEFFQVTPAPPPKSPTYPPTPPARPPLSPPSCPVQGAPKFHQFLLLSRTVFYDSFPAQAAVASKSAQPYPKFNFQHNSKL